jgi:hypothetical protein
MDIQGYFMSIDRSLLYEMVSRVIIKNSGKITAILILVMSHRDAALFFT